MMRPSVLLAVALRSVVPYRIDLRRSADDSLDRLVQLGALDVEVVGEGLAALMPDGVAPETIASALGIQTVRVSKATGRDDGSVWILSPREVRAGRYRLVPAHLPAPAGAIRLNDGPAFGTGLHPTTALCLEALDAMLDADLPEILLDVGTGSGVLALAALTSGARKAVGLDIDREAIRAAAGNARTNDLSERLLLVEGGLDAIGGVWPLVLANVLAAPLMEMAPTLVRRIGHEGRLLLSGIPLAVSPDVERTYRNLGMRQVGATARAGWTALVFRAMW